jgi:hypothetical protein
MITFEWAVTQGGSKVQFSFNLKMNEDQVRDLLSRYEPGKPVNNDDAAAIFGKIMALVNEHKDTQPQIT